MNRHLDRCLIQFEGLAEDAQEFFAASPTDFPLHMHSLKQAKERTKDAKREIQKQHVG